MALWGAHRCANAGLVDQLQPIDHSCGDGVGRFKVNPLAQWTRDDVADFMRERQLPRHPLVAKGYPSIGCAPCTTPVAPGEDPRAGRWRNEAKTECGIHTPLTEDGELPPGYEPFL